MALTKNKLYIFLFSFSTENGYVNGIEIFTTPLIKATANWFLLIIHFVHWIFSCQLVYLNAQVNSQSSAHRLMLAWTQRPVMAYSFGCLISVCNNFWTNYCGIFFLYDLFLTSFALIWTVKVSIVRINQPLTSNFIDFVPISFTNWPVRFRRERVKLREKKQSLNARESYGI